MIARMMSAFLSDRATISTISFSSASVIPRNFSSQMRYRLVFQNEMGFGIGVDLLLVPAVTFGCPNHLRIAYCVDTAVVERSLPIFKELMEGK